MRERKEDGRKENAIHFPFSNFPFSNLLLPGLHARDKRNEARDRGLSGSSRAALTGLSLTVDWAVSFGFRWPLCFPNDHRFRSTSIPNPATSNAMEPGSGTVVAVNRTLSISQ